MDIHRIYLTGGIAVYITEEKEEMVLILLEQTGMTLRKLKAEIRQMCSMNKYVKSSTILDLCDRIENEQREFARLDDMLTELENAF